MEIKQTREGQKLTIAVKGCLDTTTSPDLMGVVETQLGDVTELLIDFTDLEYISSAGFRVLLMANKILASSGGTLAIKGVIPSVREVFDMTGFSDILTLV